MAWEVKPFAGTTAICETSRGYQTADRPSFNCAEACGALISNVVGGDYYDSVARGMQPCPVLVLSEWKAQTQQPPTFAAIGGEQ